MPNEQQSKRPRDPEIRRKGYGSPSKPREQPLLGECERADETDGKALSDDPGYISVFQDENQHEIYSGDGEAAETPKLARASEQGLESRSGFETLIEGSAPCGGLHAIDSNDVFDDSEERRMERHVATGHTRDATGVGEMREG
jgi:hypothetical protein